MEEENRRLYGEYYKEINTRVLSNTENYDKSILSLSTTILTLSLAFINNIVPYNLATNTWMIIYSWGFFIIAIISVVGSFLVGNIANERHLEFAEDYYLKNDDDALNKKSNWTTLTVILNYLSGFSFIVAIMFTVIFVGINIDNKETIGNVNQIKPVITKEVNMSSSENNSSQDNYIKRGMPPPKIPAKPDPKEKK